MNLVSKVKEYAENNSLLSWGDKIIVGVSGGPDSLCLLHILYALKEDYELTLIVAHVNHNLREEAKLEAEFVESIAKKLGLEFYLGNVDIEKLSKEKKKSCEEVAREYRYNFFNDILEKTNAQKIAVAHNLNDNAETILMHIIRGSGIEGVKGISAKKNNIIRPLLHIERAEIEQYCIDNNLAPRIDKTNFESIYTRNKVRNDLIPLLRKINPEILVSLNRLGNILAEEDEFICEYIDKIYNDICIGKDKLSKNKILALPKGLQRRILRKAILEFKGNLVDISYSSLENAINSIITSKNGNVIKIANGIKIFVNYDVLEIIEKLDKKVDYEYEINIPGQTYIKELDITINAEIKSADEVEEFIKNPNKKFFDIEKTGKKLYVRNRRVGDVFSPNGIDGTKKIKDFFSDLKIPTGERDRIPILTNDKEIIWIMGFRTSKNFLKDKDTKEVIILDYGKNV